MTVTLAGIPMLETERLILRAPAAQDEDAAVDFYMSDRSQYMGGPHKRTNAYYAYATEIGHWVTRGFGMWAVTERGDDTCLGYIGCWYPLGWPEKELGWTLFPNAEGKGYGFEAAQAARSHAYSILGWTTAVSYIDYRNTRSIALAERLGCTRDDAAQKVDPEDLVYRHPGPEAP